MTPSYEPGSVEHALDLSETLRKCPGMRPALFPVRKKRPLAGSHGHNDAVTEPEKVHELSRRKGGKSESVPMIGRTARCDGGTGPAMPDGPYEATVLVNDEGALATPVFDPHFLLGFEATP